MKGFIVSFGNGLPIGLGLYIREEFVILGDDLTDAMVKSMEAVDAVKAGLSTLGFDPKRLDQLRVLGVEEEYCVLNAGGKLNNEYIESLIASVKGTFEEE